MISLTETPDRLKMMITKNIYTQKLKFICNEHYSVVGLQV